MVASRATSYAQASPSESIRGAAEEEELLIHTPTDNALGWHPGVALHRHSHTQTPRCSLSCVAITDSVARTLTHSLPLSLESLESLSADDEKYDEDDDDGDRYELSSVGELAYALGA